MQRPSVDSLDAASDPAASGPSSVDQALPEDVAAVNSAQAQAYLDSLNAATHATDTALGGTGLSTGLLQATPVCLPQTANVLDAARMLEDLSMSPPVSSASASAIPGMPFIQAAAPVGLSAIPQAPVAIAPAALPLAATVIPAAATGAVPAVLPSAASLLQAAAAVPGTATAATLLQVAALQTAQHTAALQNAQAAAAAAAAPPAVAPTVVAPALVAPAVVAPAAIAPAVPAAAVAPAAGPQPPAAAALSASPALGAATASDPPALTAQAGNAAALAASLGVEATPAPPTASNVAALNAAVAAAAAPTPGNLAALNAAVSAAAAANPTMMMPPSMLSQNAAPSTSAALLSSAGLQQATAYVPTGASAAQVAAGMPQVQAVQVLIPTSSQAPSQTASTASTLSTASAIQNAVASQQVAAQNMAAMQNAAVMQNAATQNAAAVQNALAHQRLALSNMMSTASNSSAMSGLTANTLGGSTLTGATLGPAMNPSAMSTLNPSALGAAGYPGLSSGMAGVGSPGSSAFGGPLCFSPSEVSLNNLKSMSVASSVLSAAPVGLDPTGTNSNVVAQMAALNAAAAAAAAAPSTATSAATSVTSSGQKKVRVLLSSGGVYEELPSASQGDSSRSVRWRYVGGETRLVGLVRTNKFSQFLQSLSKATSWDDSCRLMYDLPGADGECGTMIDLLDDDDLDMMWEELDSFMAVRPGFRLHIYAQLGSKRGSAEGSSGTMPSADGSDVIKERTSAGTTTDTPFTAAAGGPSSASADNSGQQHSSTTTFTCSEYDDLVEDLVTESPKISLSDLEARLEIIKPEDLEPLRLLGTGGFGEVYLCHWHSCDVAVKCLNPNLLVPDGAMGSISKENVSELLKEAALLGSVRHPNIVWVYGLVLPAMDATLAAVRNQLGPGQEIDAVKMATQMANKHRQETPGMGQIRPPALVTEFLASGSLRAAITRRADFLSRDSVRIKLALDAARGMDYLHSKHIVHFDLKTANLLVGMRDKMPICKVADFGLSKQKQQTFVTGVATLRGTLPWIAPEIIKTPGTCTEAVDVYSFGVVLWELWTLREPFEGINYHALLHMMSSHPEAVKPAMPGTAEYDGEAPPEPAAGWSDLVTDCLATRADARPTFRVVVGRLEGMMRTNRMAKRRVASSPAAPTGTSGIPSAALGLMR